MPVIAVIHDPWGAGFIVNAMGVAADSAATGLTAVGVVGVASTATLYRCACASRSVRQGPMWPPWSSTLECGCLDDPLKLGQEFAEVLRQESDDTSVVEQRTEGTHARSSVP